MIDSAIASAPSFLSVRCGCLVKLVTN
jgi:hypothetical protein